MKNRLLNSVWVWRVGPAAVLIIIRLVRQYQAGYLGTFWPGNLLLAAGWAIGWLLADADHLFYATMCNPHELTCQRVKEEMGKRDLRNAWRILEDTKGERVRLPIRNVLTGFVMTGVGLWLVSSGAGLLASGTALGFAVRLFSEAIADTDYQKWYWLFARKFDEAEHRGLLLAWGAVLIWQWSILARG